MYKSRNVLSKINYLMWQILLNSIFRITAFSLVTLLLLVASASAWACTSSHGEVMTEVDGRDFYMVADPRCRQRPILTGSVWFDCDFDGKNVVILARSGFDLDRHRPPFDFDLRKEMLIALVADTPMEQFVANLRDDMWGIGTQERFSGETFVLPYKEGAAPDRRKMVMFHAVQAGQKTLGVVAIGDAETVPGPVPLSVTYRLPIAVKAMLKSFRHSQARF